MDTIQSFTHTTKSQERMKYFNFTNTEIDQFTEIFQNAQQKLDQGISAKEQLKSMSTQDKELIKRYRSLADSINQINQLSEEGATNLLKQYDNEVDFNNDAIVEVGKAKTFVFPPVNTSQKVKDAWSETTKDMTVKEKMLAELPFVTHHLIANIKQDYNGQVIGINEPGAPNYKSPFTKVNFSWDDLISNIQNHYQEYKNHYTPKQFKDVMTTMTNFSKNLNQPLT
ncbi:MAG: hypothetical protein KC646_16095 [Candidatus Cloacimonetes bacterium]|nr:hypothetical protein [Candidatus Cloacimonadota bacterium]